MVACFLADMNRSATPLGFLAPRAALTFTEMLLLRQLKEPIFYLFLRFAYKFKYNAEPDAPKYPDATF